VKPRQTRWNLNTLALALLVAVLSATRPSLAAERDSAYLGRPIYSDPAHGLQLPPGCVVEPTWRSRIGGTEMEVWVVNCDSVARVWLLVRQVVEMLNAREARVRFQVVDERELAGETAGESLSVQCTGSSDASAIVVYGARWRNVGHELRLAGAHGALRADVPHRRLIEADLSGVECLRFPDREAMMRKLQQTDHAPR
jgi:hypothetical protein